MITHSHLVILLSNLLLVLVHLGYRVNWRLEFRLASKRGDLDDKEILQQFTALHLDEFTCSCSRSTYKAREGKLKEQEEGKSRVNNPRHVTNLLVVRTRGYDVVDDHDRLSRRDRVRLHFKLVLFYQISHNAIQAFHRSAA
jgi:hypothetical protein